MGYEKDVLVDRLTKSAHFIPVNMEYPLEKLAQLYIGEIVRLHGIPSSIVTLVLLQGFGRVYIKL